MLTRSMTKYYQSDEYKREISESVYKDLSLKPFINHLIKKSVVKSEVNRPSIVIMGRKYYRHNFNIITNNKPTISKAQSIIDAQIPLSNDVYQTIYDLLCEIDEIITKNGHVTIHTQVEVKLLGRRFTIGKNGLNIEPLFGEKTVSFYGDIYPYNM
jgi:hypothetical protein